MQKGFKKGFERGNRICGLSQGGDASHDQNGASALCQGEGDVQRSAPKVQKIINILYSSDIDILYTELIYFYIYTKYIIAILVLS